VFYNYYINIALVLAHSVYICIYIYYRILLFRLTSLVDSLRANHDSGVLVDRASAGPTAHIHSGILQVRVSNLSRLFKRNKFAAVFLAILIIFSISI